MRYVRLLSSLALFFGSVVNANADVHTVYVYDFYYQPAHITIDQEDTVRWVWVHDFHDVRSGLPPGQAQTTYDDAFMSPVENANYVHEVVFTRTLLKENPAPNNIYEYYCSPHYLDNMLGSITVVRKPTAITAVGSGSQVVPPNGSAATIDCIGEMDGDETQLTLTCTHDVANASGASIRHGVVGSNGDTVCSIGHTSPMNITCPLTGAMSDQLYDGELYITVASPSYPGGEVRAQLLRSATGLTISGKVRLQDGSPLPGVVVSDGTRSATSDATGDYTITGVPSGVYNLTGTKEGYSVAAITGINPVVLNGFSQANKNLVGAVGELCLPDSDDDGVCDSVEQTDGTNYNDPGSYRDHLSSPIYSLWNGFLSMTNILELINRSNQDARVIVSLYGSNGVKASEIEVAIGAKSQRDLIVNEMTGFAADSYGIVTVEFAAGLTDALDGRLSYYRASANGAGMEFAFAVPFVPPVRGESAVTFNTYQPSLNPVESTDVVAQWLAIVNLASTAQNYTVTRYNQLGTIVSIDRVGVPAFGRLDIEAGHLNPGPQFVGLHVIRPDSKEPYLAQLFRYGLTSDPSRYSFAFPLLARRGNGETQQVSISRGANGENWLELANVTNASVGVALRFYDTAGTLLDTVSTSLDPFAQQHFNAGARLPDGASGHVEVVPTADASVIGQSMFYFRDASGSINAMYGSHLSESYGSKIFGSYNLYLGMFNWLRIYNTSSSASTVTLTIHPPGQDPSVSQFLLGARSGTDLGLHDVAQFNTAPDTFGVVELESSQPFSISGELLRLRTTPNGLIDFAAPTRMR